MDELFGVIGKSTDCLLRVGDTWYLMCGIAFEGKLFSKV